jgi:hypothetical protein
VSDTPLLKEVIFLQTVLRQDKLPAEPSLRIPPRRDSKGLRCYLFTPPDGENQGRRLEVDRYRFLASRLLRDALEAGNAFVWDCTHFRRFEDNLIGDER